MGWWLLLPLHVSINWVIDFMAYHGNLSMAVFLFSSLEATLIELISDILLWTPSHGWAKAGRPARTYIQQLCANTGYSLEGAMDNKGRWQERVRKIHAGSMTWWRWHINPFFRLFNANFCWFGYLVFASCIYTRMKCWRFKFFYIDQLLLKTLVFCLHQHIRILLLYCLQCRNIVFLVLGRCDLSMGVLLNMRWLFLFE